MNKIALDVYVNKDIFQAVERHFQESDVWQGSSWGSSLSPPADWSAVLRVLAMHVLVPDVANLGNRRSLIVRR